LTILIQISIAITSMVLSAHVLSAIWGWFVAPVFGLPPITPVQAYGLIFVISAAIGPMFLSVTMTLHPKMQRIDEDAKAWLRATVPPLVYGGLWVAAALYHSLFF
jgi:hypothetical protein